MTRIARRGTPTDRAASTKSFSRCARIEPRSSRAKIGTFVVPTATMICQRPWPSAATIPIASSSPGIASMTSMTRMISAVDEAAEVAGDRAENKPTESPTADRDDADHEREARAVDDPRSARRGRAGRRRASGAPTGPGSSRCEMSSRFWARGSYGAISGAKMRDEHEHARRARSRRSRPDCGAAATTRRCHRPPWRLERELDRLRARRRS